MPSLLFKFFHLYQLLQSILLYFIPQKLRHFLPTSFHPKPTITSVVPSPSPPDITSSPMDSGEIRRIFQMFDRNGDGRITRKELNDSLDNMGIVIPDSDLTKMIEEIDVNGDGCVDIDEFGALYQSIIGLGRGTGERKEEEEDEDIREAFNVFDRNGDGFITVDELRSVLSSLGLKQGRTADDCRRMISKVDADGDGRVNFSEFKQMMKGGGFAALT
ncbi:calmodulin-like protein 3 [Impatiens glandulifera]|uniref:calmodulin-like protein 3 n=1 Tax=Impatiens glandulifera TaxID=253017 RepID=UPI001FB0BEB3|nr:calmodulin-like protein 3 [Impatiens glandulifera]